MNRNDNEIGNRLRIIADTVFKTHSDLAEKLNISSGVMSKYINSKINPGFSFMKKMHELGFSSAWILDGEGGMFAQNDQGKKLSAKHADVDTISNVMLIQTELIKEEYESVERMCSIHDFDFKRISSYLSGDTKDDSYFNKCFRESAAAKKLIKIIGHSQPQMDIEALDDIHIDTGSVSKFRDSVSKKVSRHLKTKQYINVIEAFSDVMYRLIENDLDTDKDPEKRRLRRENFKLKIQLMLNDKKQLKELEALAQRLPDDAVADSRQIITDEIVDEFKPLIENKY
ncbi:MAG: helix-turn-helix transcriptional regulator [Chlorobi bacterium]|nr:helix-turn-helix transcriptional regulator [Chlorobiota bacterium]